MSYASNFFFSLKNLVTRESPIYFIVAQLLLQDQDTDYLLGVHEVLTVNE